MSGRQAEKRRFERVKRLVVKVGTSLLSDSRFHLDQNALELVAANIMAARRRGIETVLVTSGAVAAGMGGLGLDKKPAAIVEKQACAAVGQSILMHEYGRIFGTRGLVTAQVLLTRHDIAHRAGHQTVRQVFQQLLASGTLPIVNENDAVSVEELKFGDNDTLSGLVAELVEADMLILLTDVDGLYAGEEKRRRRLSIVPEVTPEVYSHAGGSGSAVSTGGMVTKLRTAERMARAGRATIIASGRAADTVERILEGDDLGTLFPAADRRLQARKRWIADYLQPAGRVMVDAGATRALRERGSSLLPSGIIGVEGDFGRGAAILVVDEQGGIVGQGFTVYGAEEIRRIQGVKSSRIRERLGYSLGEEVVHRDDLVVSEAPETPVAAAVE